MDEKDKTIEKLKEMVLDARVIATRAEEGTCGPERFESMKGQIEKELEEGK